jgi:hypothetical protein
MMRYIFLLLLLTFPAHAEIYSWVDDNGKKHFGDRVPEKYKDQADNVELKMYQPTEQDIEETKRRTDELIQNRKLMESTHRSVSSSRNTSKKNKKQYGSTYDKQMAEYQSAKACFAACQTKVPSAPYLKQGPGGSYASPGRMVINNDACGHCKNVKKPQR